MRGVRNSAVLVTAVFEVPRTKLRLFATAVAKMEVFALMKINAARKGYHRHYYFVTRIALPNSNVMNDSAIKPAHLKYRPDIDGLRAIAVISVVFFHAFPNWFPGGFIGVDIFFVISGYLISLIIFGGLENGTFSFTDFYSHRIRRIFPALLLVFVFVYLIGWHSLSTGEFAQLGKHIAGGAGFISNLILWNESGYFDSSSESKILLHLWSLGIEEQFYLLWPLLAYVGWKLRMKFSFIVAAIAILSFSVNIYFAYVDVAADFYLPFSRFWELAIGSFVARPSLYVNPNHAFRIGWLSMIGFLLIGLAEMILNGSMTFPGWWGLLPTMGAALIIFSGQHAWLNHYVLSRRILVWFGLISFPLYLWHWPIFTLWSVVTFEKRTFSITLALIALSIFLAWVTYRFIEKPIRVHGGNKTVLSLFLLMVAVGYVGYNTYIREGLPSRKASKDIVASEYIHPDSTVPNCSVGTPEQMVINLPKECFAAVKTGIEKRSVFLWGDSHVANVFYGLTDQKIQELDIDLRYAMKGGCPPVLDFLPRANSSCIPFNEFVLEQVKKAKPDTVVLIANWALYDGFKDWHYLGNDKIVSTINRLRDVGVHQVILMGNFPVFEFGLPKIGAHVFKPGMENRTYLRFDFTSARADKRIGSLAKELGVKFISPIDALCNQQGCLISTSESEFIPFAYDVSHLSFPGSKYFINQFINRDIFR